MLQAMQGFLLQTPEVRQVAGPDDRVFRMAMVDILYRDGRPGSELSNIRVIAWDKQADHLAKYQAGEEIQFIGRLNAVKSRDRPGTTELSFTIQSIDDSCTLVSAVEEFLQQFTPPNLSLSDKIQQAQMQKEQKETTGRGPSQDIHP